jgi:DNA-binding transcriptional LysR family regulator
MELRQLRYAVTLSSTLHFGRAAELEFISQPAFSQQIARLERELGAKLFIRGPRTVTLTPAGKAFVARAEQLLRESADMHAEVRRIATGERERLRVGMMAGAVHELMPLILNTFRSTYPEVLLEFVDVTFEDQVATILEGPVDVAFFGLPIDDERVACDALFAEPRSVALPEGHPHAEAPSLSVEDIVGLPFVAAAEGSPDLWTRFWRCDEERGGPVVPVARTSTVTQTFMAVAHLGGVDTGPSSAFRYTTYPGAVGVPLHDGPYACAVLAYRPDETRAAITDFRKVAQCVAQSQRDVVAGAVAPEAAPPGTPLPSR